MFLYRAIVEKLIKMHFYRYTKSCVYSRFTNIFQKKFVIVCLLHECFLLSIIIQWWPLKCVCVHWRYGRLCDVAAVATCSNISFCVAKLWKTFYWCQILQFVCSSCSSMYIHILRRMRELNGCAWISNFAKKNIFSVIKKILF